MRNLTKTLAVVSILAPASAYPLGIGDIKLHSALNQTLNAEIALVLSGEKPSDIQVNLAPPDKFNEAGVPWSYFLSKIRFETVVKPNGSVIIKLTSNEALKEPFLDLLLEVSWPKGNLYREFTVLVDPPAVYKQAAVPVLTTPESPERYQREEQYAAPQRSTSSRKAQTYFAKEGKYGPTRKNDTLWKVAEQVSRDEDVSVEQMMIALYQENPRAFYQENVNALAAGKTLNIPEREVILKLSRKQALAEFNRQTIAWKNRLASAPAEAAPDQQEVLNNQLTLDAPAEAVVPENAVIAPGNEQVAAADQKSDKSAQASSDKAGTSATDDVIQSKIEALEKQLAAMQQIIALKDQQLAALQSQGQAKPAVPEQPVQPEAVAQDEQPEGTAQVIQEPPVKSEAVEQEPAVKPEPVVQDQPAKPESVVQEQPVQPAPKPAEATKPVTQAEPVVQPAVQPQPEESTGMLYPVVGGIGAAMLALLGLWWRKRKVEEETNTESMFATSSAGKAYGAGLAVASSVANSVSSSKAESSFLSEFSPTDFTSFDIDQDEIDPISEADVYLAYGRYQQAEELIRHAINDFPERDDCKLKLLEIFHATDNKKAFETYANELAESGKKDNTQFWAKVSEMGKEICSGSNLFSSAAAIFDTELNTSSNGTPVNLDKSDSVQEKAEQDNNKFTSANESVDPYFIDESDGENDFDLTSFAVNDDTDDQKNDTSIDFDLSSFAADSPAIHEPDSPLNLDEDRVLDFDVSPKNSEAKSNNSDSSINDDFEGFDFSFEDESDLNKKSDISLDDDFQFNFNLGLPSDESQDQKNSLGVSDLTDMDELETKLDLARAYIDMGDADSAKDIVKEVLEKGTSEQQKIAQTLLVDLK